MLRHTGLIIVIAGILVSAGQVGARDFSNVLKQPITDLENQFSQTIAEVTKIENNPQAKELISKFRNLENSFQEFKDELPPKLSAEQALKFKRQLPPLSRKLELLTADIKLFALGSSHKKEPVAMADIGENINACLVSEVKIPPRIDGRLDDTCWKKAREYSGFILAKKKLPRQQTTFSILHDKENIYLGITCQEADIEGVVDLIKEKDGPVSKDDCIEIFINTNPQGLSYYHFMANSSGVQYESLDNDKNWDGKWKVKTSIGEKAWFVEVSIPFKSLNRTPRPGETWRFNLCRERKASANYPDKHAENSCWSLLSRGFHEPEGFGMMVFNDYALTLKKEVENQHAIIVATGKTMEQLSGSSSNDEFQTKLQDIKGRLRTLKLKSRLSDEDYLRILRKLKDSSVSLNDLSTRINREYLRLSGEEGEIEDYLLSPFPSYQPFLTNKVFQTDYLLKILKDKPEFALSTKQAINEYEHTGFVISARNDLKDITIEATDLVSSSGHKIPKEKVSFHLIGWLPHGKVVRKKDYTREPMPDLVEEIDTPFSIKEYRNRHIWAMVDSFDAKPGKYEGKIHVSASNSQQKSINITVEVWDFELPKDSPLWSTIFTSIPWAGESGEAWAKLLKQHYVTHIMTEQPGDILVNGKELMNPFDRKYISSIEGTLDVEFLGRKWDHLKRLKIVKKYGLKLHLYSGRGLIHWRLLPAYVSYLKKAGLSYDDFFYKIGDEDTNPRTLPVFKELKRTDPKFPLCFFPAGNWDISAYAPYTDRYGVHPNVGGFPRYLKLFKEEQAKGKKWGLYTNRGSWAGRCPPLSTRRDFWGYVWKYKMDGFFIWTGDIYPPQGNRIAYGYSREDISNFLPEEQSTAQLVYVRKTGEFHKPISCKRLEGFRDGVRDYLYLSILDNLITKARDNGKAGLAREGEERLREIISWTKRNEKEFHRAKESLAKEILRISSAL